MYVRCFPYEEAFKIKQLETCISAELPILEESNKAYAATDLSDIRRSHSPFKAYLPGLFRWIK